RLSESKTRNKSICNLPKVELIERHEDHDRQKTADQPAVKNSARTQKIETEDLHVRLNKIHQRLRPDQPAKQGPQTQIINAIFRYTVPCPEPRSDNEGAQHPQREKDAVRRYRKCSDSE